MYKFHNFDGSVQRDHSDSKFIELLKSRWDEIEAQTGVFLYKTGELQQKHVGKYILQLNTDRGVKRRTPELINNILQPFCEKKFNFTKVSDTEVLFKLIDDNDEIHTLLVNVSPISRYHTLLCPTVSKCLPQVITEDSLNVALHVMLMAQDRNLRIGFNSLCALASVNHLHYHLLFDKGVWAVDKAICKHIQGPLHYLEDYAIPGFCFFISSKKDIQQRAKEVYKLVKYFLDNSIAHNILMTQGEEVGGARILVWPRKSSSGAKQMNEFNIATVELAGWFTVYNKESFETLNVEDLDGELRKWTIPEFDDLLEKVKVLF